MNCNWSILGSVLLVMSLGCSGSYKGRLATAGVSGKDAGAMALTGPGAVLFSGQAANRCLDSAAGDTVNGTVAVINDCNTSSARQNWVMTAAGELRLSGTNRCLDTAGGSLANSTRVVVNECSGAATQKWTVAATSGAYGAVQITGSNECLDVDSGRTAAGSSMNIYQCQGSGNQKWIEILPPAVASVQLVGKGSSRCVDSAAGDVTDGVTGIINDCNPNSARQALQVTAANEIRLAGTGRCLGTAGGSTANSALVGFQTCSGAAAQKWTVNASATAFSTVILANTTQCLDVTGAGNGNGSTLNIYPCKNQDNQLWEKLTPAATAPVRFSGQQSGRCLDAAAGDTVDGTTAIINDCSVASSRQSWQLTAAQELRLSGTSRCLDTAGKGTADSTLVVVTACSGVATQKWQVDTSIGAFGLIKIVGTNQCLDVTGGGTAVGTSVNIYHCSGSLNQQWTEVAPPPVSAPPPVNITAAADTLRTSWYSDQPKLAPATVSSATFGQLFSKPVNGFVYAQPLVSNGVLLVATETNNVYGIDPVTGAQKWTRNIGQAWDATALGCADLKPSVGVTGTPVIDPVTNIAYMFAKSYDSSGTTQYYMHALNVADGTEVAGFPVLVAGAPTNDQGAPFVAQIQLQRPGLLLMNGVVYAGFASHCDEGFYHGYIVGVSTAGRMATMWSTTVGAAHGGGIWHPAGGLVADATGSLLFAVGNAYNSDLTAPTIGYQPPANLTEAVVRLTVNSNGSLSATDFFEPNDAAHLDDVDADLGSGGPVALPGPYFGTAKFPHLMLVVGKEGRMFLMNRDDLGGFETGAGAGDRVISTLSIGGGVWGKPSAYGGEGGYIYVAPSSSRLLAYKYGIDGSGNPAFSKAGQSNETYGFLSGSPIITSDGTNPGTGLVWIIGQQDSSGAGGAVRAYDAVPVNGSMTLRFQASLGTASKFALPGVADGRIYVGTRDGKILGFGSPITSPVTGSAVNFGSVVVGQSVTKAVTVRANQNLSLTGLSSNSNAMVVAAQTLPVALAQGQTYSVNVTFTPTAPGPVTAALTFTTSAGSAPITLSGTGVVNGPSLTSNVPAVSFGGTAVNTTLTGSVVLSNVGSSAVTIGAVTLPDAPFTATGVPQSGATLQPGASITVGLSFAPTATGSFISSLVVASNGGTATVGLSGNAGNVGVLTITPISTQYGNVALGSTKSASFTLTNTGGSSLTITKSKPPTLGSFSATTLLNEGTILAAGQSLTETVVFTPAATGLVNDVWVINSTDNSGLQNVAFQGTGTSTGVSIHVNFQPATSAPVSGYLVDSGAVYGDRGNGFTYGWNVDNSAQTRERTPSVTTDRRLNTLIHMQRAPVTNGVWEIALPNGTYKVHIAGGDADFLDNTIKINAEGVLVASGTPTASAHFIEGTATVTVTDGKLTVTNGTGAANVKIDYIDITQ